MPDAASSVTTWSREQMMLEMVQDRIATGVTRVVWMVAVLRCGKQMEKPPHYYFSWIVSFLKYIYIFICEMLPPETKQSRGKLLPHSDLQEEVFLGEISSSRRYSYDMMPCRFTDRYPCFTKHAASIFRLYEWKSPPLQDKMVVLQS